MLALNPLSRIAFHQWVKTKPRDEAYDFCDMTNCALLQYLKVSGLYKPGAYSQMVLDDAALHNAAADKPYTFGDLADRLAAL